tara:strand:+ start:4630 stop:5352 length:723 start_codon:yes stop_codon:yes gene_type:complete
MDFGGKYFAIWTPIWLLSFGVGFGLIALITGNGNATQPQQIASTSDSPSGRPVATDPKDDVGSGMDGSGETVVRGGMGGNTNPTGGSSGNTFRGGKDPLDAIHGHWKCTEWYQHDDQKTMTDGKPGAIVKKFNYDRTLHRYFDSSSKVWILVRSNDTTQRGTFEVSADSKHSGKFSLKIVYEGSKDQGWAWAFNHKHYLSNNNTTWDDQWVTRGYEKTGEIAPDQYNAERWVYVDGKTSP